MTYQAYGASTVHNLSALRLPTADNAQMDWDIICGISAKKFGEKQTDIARKIKNWLKMENYQDENKLIQQRFEEFIDTRKPPYSLMLFTFENVVESILAFEKTIDLTQNSKES